LNALLSPLVALIAAASPATASVEQGPVMRAMRDELDRSKSKLALPGEPNPYYIAYTIEDYDQAVVSAAFGAVQSSNQTRRRFMRSSVRVGSPTLDNSNFYRTSGFGSSGGIEWVQVENDYDALRHEMWLATDRAYKDAVQALEAKRGSLKDETTPADEAGIPDFSEEKPARTLAESRPAKPLDVARYEALAKKLSSVFREFPEVQADSVTISASTSVRYFLSTEGTVSYLPEAMVRLEIACSTQADDGMDVDDDASFAAKSLDGLPADADLVKEVRRVAGELVKLRHAPAAADYSGPVLFEGEAAAQLIRVMLVDSFSGTPPAKTDSRSMSGFYGHDTAFASKIGLRVLPLGYHVEDDPSLSSYRGLSLVGGMLADSEGMPPQKVTLVEDGKLKAFVMSRTPRKDFPHTNGHGRGTLSGEPRGMISNLVIIPPSKDAMTPAALRKKLLAEAKNEGYGYGLVVRLLDDPSVTRAVSDGNRGGFGRGSDDSPALPAPLILIKVTPDGKETLLRGATFGSLAIRAMKDILAAGRDPSVCDYFATGSGAFASAAPASTPSIFVIPTSVVTPSLLVKDLDVKKPTGSNRKLPLLAHPYFVAQH
jgi:TldD protein